MRRSVLIACIMSVFMVVPVFAATIGPVNTKMSAGDTSFGLGYSLTDSQWEDTGVYSDLKIRQHRFFAQAGYGISDTWLGYVRGGLSTLNADNAFLPGEDYEADDPIPFVTAGVNGRFYKNGNLSIGGFVQGSYFFGENEDSYQYVNVLDPPVGAETVKETVTLDTFWEAKAGLQLQMEVEGAQLYGGPMYYISRADIENSLVGAISGPWAVLSKTVEEEDNFGVVVGIQWQLLEDVSLDLEAQMRSSYDFGFVLNKRF